MIVAGAGTGGTITGIARKMKEKCPECIVCEICLGPVLSIDLFHVFRTGHRKHLQMMSCFYLASEDDISIVHDPVSFPQKACILGGSCMHLYAPSSCSQTMLFIYCLVHSSLRSSPDNANILAEVSVSQSELLGVLGLHEHPVSGCHQLGVAFWAPQDSI